MSTLVLNPTNTIWADNAVSVEAKEIGNRLRQTIDADPSVAWGKRRWDLNAACWEASEANWDGYGAGPVELATYEVAKKFLDVLPSTPADPDIAIDPDGEVSITWRKAPRQVFSVSIGGDGRISFAGIFGARDIYGTEYFVDQTPPAVVAVLARLFPTGI